MTDAPAWVGFPGAAQVAQLRRTRTVKGRKTVEVVYLITSAAHHDAPPAVLAAWVNGHAQALRHHAGHPDRAVTRALTC